MKLSFLASFTLVFVGIQCWWLRIFENCKAFGPATDRRPVLGCGSAFAQQQSGQPCDPERPTAGLRKWMDAQLYLRLCKAVCHFCLSRGTKVGVTFVPAFLKRHCKETLYTCGRHSPCFFTRRKSFFMWYL